MEHEGPVGSLTSGRLKVQLAALAAVPHGAVVVEDCYSEAFRQEVVLLRARGRGHASV